MKTKFLSLFAITALLMSACHSHDDDNVIPGTEAGTEIRVASSLSGTVTSDTRAYDATWETSDAIGVYIVDATTPTTILYPNLNYVYDSSNPTWVTTNYQAFKYSGSTPPFYPVNDDAIQLVAYYPYNNAWSNFTNSQNIVVTDQTSQSAIDLLYADITTGSHKKSLATNPIDLNFKHKLSKLIIKVKAGDGLTATEVQGVAAQLKQFSEGGTFKIEDGTVTTSATPADFVPFKATQTVATAAGVDAQFEAILMPQTFTAGSEKVEFTIGSDVFTWNLNNTSTTTGTANLSQLEAGKKYTYTITINRKGILVDGIITDWTDGTSGEGVAE